VSSEPAALEGEVPTVTLGRILIVEDQRLLAEALRRVIDLAGATVVGIVHTVTAVWPVVDRARPDLVLLDLNLPDGSGLELGRELASSFPELKVVALTADSDPAGPARARDAGFQAFLTKDLHVTVLARSVVDLLGKGTTAVKPRAARPWPVGAEPISERAIIPRLTKRQTEVLRLLGAGSTSKEIARALRISRHTVRTHVQSILQKLQVHSRLEAVALAARTGLLSSDSD
jgi:DNA-binding NarL/FixJ family response regulator